MKNSILSMLFLLYATATMAQGVFSNHTNYALEKVVQDYPSQFKNIRGELLASGPAIAEYNSKITIPGAVSTVISQPEAQHKQAVGWQSVLYTGADFNTAKSHFEDFFNQIKNTIIKPEGEKAVIVNGFYRNPSADKTFTTIQFDLMPAMGFTQKINIDLTLRNTGTEWKIILSVYDKNIKENELLAITR